jgi:hypothetical protein
VAHGSDGEATKWTNHEKEAKGVADVSGHANQGSAQEDDQSVEHLPGRYPSPSQLLLRATHHTNADASDDEGTKRTHENQDGQRPEETDLFDHSHEGNDLCGNEQQCAKEKHR